MFFTLLWVKYRQKYIMYHYHSYIRRNRVWSSFYSRQLNNSHWPRLEDGYISQPAVVKLKTNSNILKARRSAAIAAFLWYLHSWGSRWQMHLNLFLRIYLTKKQALRKPFHELLFPAINKLLPERYSVNQLYWNCTKTVFGKLRQRLKTSIHFFNSNIYHFNGCSLAFSDKAVTNFCTCSGAQSINGKYQYCFRVGNYLDHTGFMITNSCPDWVPLCCLCFSVSCEKGREDLEETTLTVIAQNIHTVLTNGDLLPCPPFSSWENKAITHMTVQVRLLCSPPSQ